MNKVISFLLGIGCGTAVTYIVVKRKINERADEEIESVVKTFKNRMDKIEELLTDEQKEKLGIYSPSKESVNKPVEIPQKIPCDIFKTSNPVEEKTETQNEYDKKIEELGYSVGVDLSEGKDKQVDYTVKHMDENVEPSPYVITEDEFGEIGNEEVTLFYYADHVMVDEDENVIDDIEDLIGDCLTQFGDYDESMYVRNERKETDFIILRSEKNFNDISPIEEVDD